MPVTVSCLPRTSVFMQCGEKEGLEMPCPSVASREGGKRSKMLSPTPRTRCGITESNLENTLNTHTEPPHCISILLWCVALFQILLVATDSYLRSQSFINLAIRARLFSVSKSMYTRLRKVAWKLCSPDWKRKINEIDD